MNRTDEKKAAHACALYEAGIPLKAIALRLNVSLPTLFRWKRQRIGGGWKAQKKPIFTASLWLEGKVMATMAAIDQAEEEKQKALRDCLDDYISMKKKYESSIDRYGETKRVMEDFIAYLKEEQRESIPLLKDIIEAYVLYVGR